jgi:hypothetical protein
MHTVKQISLDTLQGREKKKKKREREHKHLNLDTKREQ